MTGPVEEITEADYAHSFSDKVDGESCRRLAEYSDHRIQFSATTLKIGASHGKIGAIQGCGRDEECVVLLVPEPV